MPLLNLNRGPITALRQQLAQSQPPLDAARVDLALARSQLALAQSRGDEAFRVDALRAEVAAAEQLLRERARGRNALLQEISLASNQLLVAADPTPMVEALEGDIPVALLPVRLETRYLDNRTRLAIRIYPDTLHVMRHLRGLTEAERRGGQDYWAAVVAADGTQETVWRRLVAAYRAPRAQFIVQATDPAQPDEAQAVTALSRQTQALLMPDRFCAVGYAAGRREVFRAWGANVPDILPMSPELDPTLASAGEAQQALFGPEREWLFKFDAALAVGMGISVTNNDIARWLNRRNDPLPFVLTSPLQRLLVLGVDWTLDAADSADALEELLQAHAASQGLAVVPLGTATNSTGRGASALNSGELPPPPAQDAPAPAPGSTDAYDLLLRAFGFGGKTLVPGMLPGAGLAEQRTQMHMLNALWRGTFGRYLGEMWNMSGRPDPYVPDSAVRLARDFVVGHVRPGGPLPTLRIGKQPYGILPVVADLQPQGPMESGVMTALSVLRPRWQAALATVPRVDGTRLDEVRELIQSGPWSVVSEFRNIDNPNKSVIVPGWSAVYGEVQISAKRRLAGEMLSAFGIEQDVETLFEHLVHDVQDHDLAYVPWVQADPGDRKKARAPQEVLDPPYIAQIADELNGNQAKTALSRRQNGESLLEAMLAFSAEEEFDHSGLRLLDDAIAGSAFAAQAGHLALSKATPSFVNIAPPVQQTAFHELGNTRALNNLRIPAVTGGQTVEAHLSAAVAAAPPLQGQVKGTLAAQAVLDYKAALPFVWRDLGSLSASLRYLAPLKVGELDLAFRLTLDTFSYRLDAWYTGLASRRLERLRQQRASQQPADRPLGVYLGAYGLVEGLKPDTTPDSLGYTHAPSLTQAAAAAMLRSGFLANAERGGEVFNIDLSSARVQKARALIEGVERGQSPAALLGYRFERGLSDTAGMVGAQYIFDFRRRYPLRAAGSTLGEQPAEAIAARDVVDGLALLEAWRTGNPASLLSFVQGAHQAAVTQVLNDLAETWDAVSDVMVSESVYQLAQNNLDRAAAAAALVDAHASPIAPQVTQTARAGVSYAQRVVALCAGGGLPQAWAAAAAADPRSIIEPRLDALAARWLGEPSRFVFKALRMRNGAMDGEVLLNPAQLGRGPLSLVLAESMRDALVQAFSARVPAEPGLQLDILERNAPGEPPGLAEFEALARTVGRLLSGAKALARHDLVVPVDEFEAGEVDQGVYAGVDAAEIIGRANTALQALDDARQALVDAALDDDAITAALQACWPFGLREAEPGAPPVDPAALPRWQEDHHARRDRVLAEIAERQAASDRLPPEGRAPTVPESIGIAVDRIKLVFGRDFPVLPVFTLGPYATSVAASLADRASLLGADPFEIAGWLPKLARVREGADKLNATLTAHEALHEASLADDLALWQLPHKAGRAWAARPEAWAGPDPRKLVPQLAVVAAGADALVGLDASTPLAGVAVDEWQEAIPDANQTTGVSFHYDAPGARAPQAVLLAVPPRWGMTNWTLEDLLATVHEAFDLAQMRCVRPKDFVDGVGVFLPGNFLPQSFGAEVPSVELWQMARKFAGSAATTVALGKLS
ncbi:MAG: hypothetical protein JNK55_05205 [Rubrivivax sp.]|nr:hypothetical protein [Rubrivivax sp.]